MTGAPDGDVDRALAAMGATPLKYYSFGVVAVRPPEHERDRSDNPHAHSGGTDRAGFPFGISTPAGLAPPLPPSGEGTSERYRSHSVASVFPLLGLALPEAFHIDVEPVWPVGPPVSEQSVIFDRAASTPGNTAPRARDEFPNHSKFAANFDMFPQDAVRSSPTVYATPPDGESQTSSTNGGVFVMPSWLDPASAANGSLSASTNSPPLPLPWLDNLPNVEPPEQLRPVVKTDALSEWAKPANASSAPQDGQPNHGPSVYSPFVQNGVTTSDGSFEKTQEHAGESQRSLPPWLQETAPPQPAESARNPDWSLPNLNAHPLDAHNLPAFPESPPVSILAHPMPAFAPPPIAPNTQSHSARHVIHEEPTLLPEPGSHEEISPKPVHDVAYPFSQLHDQADPVSHGRETQFQSQVYPFPPPDAEPTWHEPPLETSQPDFVEINKPHFEAPGIMNNMGVPAPSHPGIYEFSDPRSDAAGLPAHNDSTPENKDQLFADIPAATSQVPPKPQTPASSRPLADLFRTLGGGGGAETPRSGGRKDW